MNGTPDARLRAARCESHAYDRFMSKMGEMPPRPDEGSDSRLPVLTPWATPPRSRSLRSRTSAGYGMM